MEVNERGGARMKVDVVSKKIFTPVGIVITFETSEQMEAFYCIFNHSTLTDWMEKHGVDHDAIRDALNSANGPGVNYYPIFDELREILRNGGGE
jgi:hypothetical protein